MKRRKLFVLTVFLSVVLLWKPALSRRAATPLSIELSTLQDVVPSRSPVKVKAEVTNTSSRSLWFTQTGLASEIEVRNSTGTLLQTTEKYRESLRKPHLRLFSTEVAPGETRKWVFVLSDMYDLSEQGQYSMQIRWPGGGEYEYPQVLSNIISVKITPATAAAPENLTAPEASFSLEIDTEQDVVRSGSTIHIGIYAKNLTDHDLDLDNDLNLFSIDVQDQSQIEPPLTEAGNELQREHGQGSRNRVHLKPGEVVGLGTLSLGQFYDFKQPGEYTLQIARMDEKSKTLVKSNTMTITVKPRSKAK